MIPSVLDEPVSLAAARVSPVGASGAVVSMVIATDVDATDSFPTASVALAVSV